MLIYHSFSRCREIDKVKYKEMMCYCTSRILWRGKPPDLSYAVQRKRSCIVVFLVNCNRR